MSRPGRPRSLTGRLLLGLLVVSAAGLTVSLLSGTVLLRDYLYGRATDQVVGLSRAPGLQPGTIPAGRLCTAPSAPEVLPSEFRLALVDADGVDRCRVPEERPGPPVPAVDDLAVLADDETSAIVDGEGGPWALSVVRVGPPEEGYVVVAISLREADQTVRRLTVTGLVVGGLVLAALALAGRSVIRIGLRPLTEVREAARGIGHGDLSARVPSGDPGTEVAELSTALNGMLTEIEQGFEERRESERRIRQFATDASHELRTPLTSIKGYAQLYAQLRAGERRDDVVRRIDTEADRMTSIVEDLLLLARLDQRPELLLEDVDLVEIAHDVLSAARARHPGRPLALQVGGPVEVTGDRGRLRQVLDNLVTNALVHTPSSVTVRIRAGGAGPDGARIEVVDRGPGMPAEVRAHAFDRFYRADAGRSHGSGGSGLGLAIVQALVLAHGGTVACASSVETGTTVTVTLPAAT